MCVNCSNHQRGEQQQQPAHIPQRTNKRTCVRLRCTAICELLPRRRSSVRRLLPQIRGFRALITAAVGNAAATAMVSCVGAGPLGGRQRHRHRSRPLRRQLPRQPQSLRVQLPDISPARVFEVPTCLEVHNTVQGRPLRCSDVRHRHAAAAPVRRLKPPAATFHILRVRTIRESLPGPPTGGSRSGLRYI